MRIREWLLSVSFVAFFALKILESVWALESWPLTHVPMFYAVHPIDDLPNRATFFAYRNGVWFEIRPFMLGLNTDELKGRLLDSPDLATSCGDLIESFNATRPLYRRVSAARVVTKTIARPQAPEKAKEKQTDCRIDGVEP